MNMERRYILLVAPVAFALVSGLPSDLSAEDLAEAKVTQVVQDVKVVSSGAAGRPVVVNETVRQGNAVQTGTQSRSELTFKDQTITRLGEKTIYNVGGGRTIELGSGQFCCTCRRKPAAHRSRWVRSPQQSLAQQYWATSIRIGHYRIYGARRNGVPAPGQRGPICSGHGRSNASSTIRSTKDWRTRFMLIFNSNSLLLLFETFAHCQVRA